MTMVPVKRQSCESEENLCNLFLSIYFCSSKKLPLGSVIQFNRPLESKRWVVLTGYRWQDMEKQTLVAPG